MADRDLCVVRYPTEKLWVFGLWKVLVFFAKIEWGLKFKKSSLFFTPIWQTEILLVIALAFVDFKVVSLYY